MKEYKGELSGALHNDFLREAMDKFAVAYRTARSNAFAGMDVDGLIQEIAKGKDEAMAHMDELLAQFTKNAEALGVTVHVAATAQEANEIIASIAKKTGTSSASSNPSP
jgi:Uncharacterized conserved protein containing a ferredoxin-like domain